MDDLSLRLTILFTSLIGGMIVTAGGIALSSYYTLSRQQSPVLDNQSGGNNSYGGNTKKGKQNKTKKNKKN